MFPSVASRLSRGREGYGVVYADIYGNIIGGNSAGLQVGNGSSTLNVLLGTNAGKNLASGTGENVAIGYLAGASFSSATQCTIIGAEAGSSVTGDTGHTLIGYQAGLLLNGNAQTWNTFVGHISGRFITTGGSNCAFGRGTLGSEVGGASYNAAFGHAALFGGTGMTGVIGVGDGAGAADPAGTANWQATGLTYFGPKDDVSSAYIGRNTGKSSAAARTGSTAVGSLARIPVKDNVMVLGHGLVAVETAGGYWDGWNRATDISSNIGVTINAAQLLSGLILHAGTLAAGVNDTTDTAANIVAAGPGANCEVPCSIERSIGNNTAGGFNITLVAGSGVAISGLGLGAAIAPGILAKFRFVITNSAPGSEAISVYRVG